MDNFWPVLLTFFFGSFFGTLLGPLLLEEARYWIRKCRWNQPRSALLRERLKAAEGQGWVSLERLMILTGTSEDECRTLLIEIDARGGKLKSGNEGWALISRQPLTKSGENVDEVE